MNRDRVKGCILAKENAGESFLRLTLFDASAGITPFLLRNSSRKTAAANTTPDLFDYAEVELQPPRENNALRFATEYHLTRRHDGIGGSYERLAAACHLARLLVRNPPPHDCLAAAYELCTRAIEAFNSRPRPDATLLKTLWQLAQNGGWPVREHWRASLQPATSSLLDSTLRAPLDAQTASAADLAPLLASLNLWLEHECHFHPA